ncbi:MAG: glycosyltransferase family 39 protein [Deltaproteobacteria bacterium]|nr:glycosyltransferase family 39 protein [Deltaproteobacteria bacterium]MCL5276188.1 glycosyltransferase family 39 protein [Deltaproteobacteria bacterium]
MNKKNTLVEIIFSSHFQILLFLCFIVGLFIYVKYPSTVYVYTVDTISKLLKHAYGTHGNINKIDRGMHKLGVLVIFLSIGGVFFIKTWEWIFHLTDEVTTTSTIKDYNNVSIDKKDWIIIVIFTVIAVILGILPIKQSLWQDEIGVYETFMKSGVLYSIFPKSSMGSHPLMQIITKLFTDITGVSELSLRFPSFLVSILSIPLFYILSLKLTGKKIIGILSSFFLTINPIHIYYSFQMRGYSFLMFFSVISLYLFIKLIIKPTKRTAIWLSIINVLLLYTHLYALFFISAQCLTLISIVFYQYYLSEDTIISNPVVPLYFLSFIWTLLIGFILYIPYIPVIGMIIFNTSVYEPHYTTFTSHIYNLLDALAFVISYSKFRVLTLIFILFSTVIASVLTKKKTVLTFVNVFFVSYVFVYLIAPVGAQRYLCPIIPILLLSLSISTYELYISAKIYFKSLGLIVVIVYSALSIAAFPDIYMPIQNYKGAVNFVTTVSRNQSNVVIVSNSLGKNEVRFYDKNIVPLNNVEELNKLLATHKNIYAIVTFEDFLKHSEFSNDRVTQKEIEDKFKLIKTFSGECPVHVWYYSNQ